MTKLLPGPAPQDAPAAPVEPPPGSLRDLCEVLFRHKKTIALFFALVVSTAFIVLSRMQHQYTSEAKILIRRGRETLLLDPTVATGEVAPLFMDWENNMNSEIEILTSRELAVQVVKSIGPERFLNPSPPPSGEPEGAAAAWLRKVSAALRALRPPAVEEPVDGKLEVARAALAFSESLDVKVVPKSNIIEISFEWPDPELAQRVVSALLDQYHALHIQANRAPGAHEFFLRETETLRRQLEQAEDDLRRLKEQSGILAIETQRTILLNRIGELKNLQELTAGQIAASTARVQAGREAVQREAAVSKVAPVIPAATYRDARSELQAEETALAGLMAQAGVLKEQIVRALGEMKGLNDHDIRLARLERDRDMLKDKYVKYCQNLEQTRIDRALQSEKISNISVIQPPTTPAYPNPLNRAVKMVLAILMGALGGVGLAFVADHFDHTLRKPEDLERALRLPTLAAIPRLRSRRLFPNWGRIEAAEDQGRSYAFLQGRRHYSALRDRIQLLAGPGREGSRVIGITSSHSGEGVSSVAANLAVAMAESSPNDRVLLVDANRDQRSAHQVFGIKKAPGAAEISTDPEGRLIIVEQNLYEVPHAEAPAPRSGALALYYNSLLRVVKERQYRFVLFDMPPLSEGSALQLARLMDGIILVVKAEGVRSEIVQRMKNLLLEVDAHVLGTVLNKRRFYIPGWLYRRL